MPLHLQKRRVRCNTPQAGHYLGGFIFGNLSCRFAVLRIARFQSAWRLISGSII